MPGALRGTDYTIGGVGVGLKGTQICLPGDKIWDSLLEEAALVMGLEGWAGRSQERKQLESVRQKQGTGNCRPTLDGTRRGRGQEGAQISCPGCEGLECQTRNIGIVFCRQRKL